MRRGRRRISSSTRSGEDTSERCRPKAARGRRRSSALPRTLPTPRRKSLGPWSDSGRSDARGYRVEFEAGTFDDAWKRERWPRMPADYSLGYWNCAPPSLRFSPWLRGDETVRAVGLRHDPRPYEFTLPGARAACLMARNDGLRSEELPLALQSVHIDIASADSSLHRVSLTWGASFPSPEGIAKLEVILEDGFKAKRGFHGQ